MRQKLGIIAASVIVGLTAVVLGIFGNPANMQFCVACFIRDIAGALGLHSAEPVRYIRPEVIGIVIGAFIAALVKKEYAPKGGSSPFTRFVLGICVMIGALVFLGCPLRVVLRIAGGDLNAVVGLAGFAGGIFTGIAFLNRGFSLKRSYDQPAAEGLAVPAVSILLLALLITAPAFLFFSESGPGSAHAPLLLSLAGGLAVGAAAQRSRLCFIGGIRDAVLFKEFNMLMCFGIILAVVFAGNVITGAFNIGFYNQPIAHAEWVWNILGLYLVGFGSVLLGGCPMRQLVMAGGGNSDAGVTMLGFITGAAISHNFALASSGAGTTPNGRIAVAICAIVMFAIAVLNSRKALQTRRV
ncbi:MAG: YedE family putative selenium transporter [Treponema sp.]|nr:YedE family putative selenium transporter [Treponema sp.]